MTTAPVHYSSAESAWYTPVAVLALARRILGGIDLDPASDAQAQRTVQAARWYGPLDDGLRQPWQGRVWCNPPYGREIGPWVRRFADAAAAGEMTAGLLLVPARTDTRWWLAVSHLPLCAWTGRLAFIGQPKGGRAPFPSALVYAGRNPDRFAEILAPHGTIYRPATAHSWPQAAAD